MGMMGAQASNDQYEKILNYINIGKDEGAEVLCGGGAAYNEGLEGGYYIQPTILKGNNKMRVSQEEIFGPVLCVTSFKDEADAIEIANDTLRTRCRSLDKRYTPGVSNFKSD